MAVKRYADYIRRSRSDRQPSHMGALAVAIRPDGGQWSGGVRPVRMDGWRMEFWHARRGRPGPATSLSSYGATDWLSCIGGMLDLHRRWTILCPNLIQSLSVSGVWDLIDRGVLRLGDSPRLLSDPPTAISLSLTDRPGCVILLDTANYGVEIEPGEDACRQTGQFARDMVAACVSRGLGSLQVTAGAQSLYGWRRSYKSHAVMTHCKADVLALEREAIHGGRAECYRLGRVEGPVYCLDWTGYYPSIMSDIDVPVRLRRWGEESADVLLSEMRHGHGVIARVRVSTCEPRWPYVRDGLTMWPTGIYDTVLCGGELLDCLDAGCALRVGQWASYDLEPALRDFASVTMTARMYPDVQSNHHLKRWYKALGVSIVGKFAQQQRRWAQCVDPGAHERWDSWLYQPVEGGPRHYRSLAGQVERESIGGETAYSCPAIAAWIYAEGRRRLWDAQLIAGRGEVYYCYTDSLYCSALGAQKLADAGMIGYDEPGKLRVTDIHPWIDILGIGHYRVPGRTVCAGAVGSGGPDSADLQPGWYSEGVGQALADAHPPLPVQRQGPRITVRPYLHGVRGADGRVTPWRV